MITYYKKVRTGLNNQSYLFPFSYSFSRTGAQDVGQDNVAAEETDDNHPNPITGTPAAALQSEEKPQHFIVAYIKPDVEISPGVQLAKRVFDVLFSLFVIILGFPMMALIYLITKYSSKGPAIYKQERVGKDQELFLIYKFRSMHLNAEAAGPQLSSEHDPRITKWGRIIRRTRLDELPQFWNVIKGEMSIVGPRPERLHFINKIVEKNPNYRKLHMLKPGLTSMGQVHFGYAENVDQMCIRMLHDLEYMKNVNLNTDIKVILKTIKVMVQCKGK